jgi:predicted DNA-binding protein
MRNGVILAMQQRITTARLPRETVVKLIAVARLRRKTKSAIIKEAIDMYYEREEQEMDSFSLGEAYFGKYGSGEDDRATTYKQRIKEKLDAKFHTH